MSDSEIRTALSTVIKEDAIGPWMEAPNPVFGGLTPAQVIRNGDGKKILDMVYFLGSGDPS